jgi:hypothetical protein
MRARRASFFKDSDGQVAIWQWPSVPLTGWLVCKLLSMVIKTGSTKMAFETLSTAFLFTWAYLEITSGKSYFRRVLGVGVMIVVLIGIE